MEYRVLTLWQPYASLLVHDIKKIETRPAPTSWTVEKGVYLIHAASKWTKEQEKICLSDPFYAPLLDSGLLKWDGLHKWKPKCAFMLPLGKIIGAIEVTECCPITKIGIHNRFAELSVPHKLVIDPELSFGDYRAGRYAWLTQNPRLLKTPIPYKGGQGYYQRFKGDISQLEFI